MPSESVTHLSGMEDKIISVTADSADPLELGCREWPICNSLGDMI